MSLWLLLQILWILHICTFAFVPAVHLPGMTSSHFLLYWTNHLYPKLFTLLVKLCKLSFLWTVGQTVRQTFYCVCGSYSVCMLNHVWLFCNPIDYSPPGSSVHGILQARILEWVAISFSRGFSRTRDRICVSYISCRDGRWVTTDATWEAPQAGRKCQKQRTWDQSRMPPQVVILCSLVLFRVCPGTSSIVWNHLGVL